ncbi:MAG TPA: hypothetical protein VJ783_28055 [Pirellulales bacterium]|nr:hypothetical protein [Pirellulales bacterium]
MKRIHQTLAAVIIASVAALAGCSENWKSNPNQPTSRAEQNTTAEEVAPSGAAETQGR